MYYLLCYENLSIKVTKLMRYKITPLNIIAACIALFSLYDVATNANADNLGGTVHVMSWGLIVFMLIVDLMLQKLAKSYRWVVIIESILALIIVYWIWGGW